MVKGTRWRHVWRIIWCQRYFLLLFCKIGIVFYWHNIIFLVAVTEGVEKATIEDENVDKKDRTVVKDKSAKLEAKLERENKKKMVSSLAILHLDPNQFYWHSPLRLLVSLLSVLKEQRESVLQPFMV